jgi:hypothetical protein
MERAIKDTSGTNTRFRFNNARPQNLHLMVNEPINVYFGDYPEDDLSDMHPDVIMDGLTPLRFEAAAGSGISVVCITIDVADAEFSALKW